MVEEVSGRQVLVVDYPWQVHARASVEIFLADEDQAEPAGAHPAFFRSRHFKGEMRLKLYRCQDRSALGMIRRTQSDEKTEFEILGRRNGLSKLSTCVVAKTLDDHPLGGAAAVFCLLDPWSVDRKLLCLEPPREYFSRAGELHVWFLRDDKILWHQTVAWPGY